MCSVVCVCMCSKIVCVCVCGGECGWVCVCATYEYACRVVCNSAFKCFIQARDMTLHGHCPDYHCSYSVLHSIGDDVGSLLLNNDLH